MPPPPKPAFEDARGLANRTCSKIVSSTHNLCEADVRALAELLESLSSRSNHSSSSNHSEDSSSSIAGLHGLCGEEDALDNPPAILCFRSQQVPQISVFDYLVRLTEFFCCSPACYVVAAAYIDRVLRSQPDFALDAGTVHRLLLASLVIAVKFTDDRPLKNTWYAKTGGVSNRELNVLEATLLKLLDWRVHVSANEYDYYCGKIWPAVQGKTDRLCLKRSRDSSPQQPLARRCRRSRWPVAGPEGLGPYAGSAEHCRGPPRRARSAPVGYVC